MENNNKVVKNMMGSRKPANPLTDEQQLANARALAKYAEIKSIHAYFNMRRLDPIKKGDKGLAHARHRYMIELALSHDLKFN
jgi:hypothetical protein